jgi:hypothetical protein
MISPSSVAWARKPQTAPVVSVTVPMISLPSMSSDRTTTPSPMRSRRWATRLAKASPQRLHQK